MKLKWDASSFPLFSSHQDGINTQIENSIKPDKGKPLFRLLSDIFELTEEYMWFLAKTLHSLNGGIFQFINYRRFRDLKRK